MVYKQLGLTGPSVPSGVTIDTPIGRTGSIAQTTGNGPTFSTMKYKSHKCVICSLVMRVR